MYMYIPGQVLKWVMSDYTGPLRPTMNQVSQDNHYTTMIHMYVFGCVLGHLLYFADKLFSKTTLFLLHIVFQIVSCNAMNKNP